MINRRWRGFLIRLVGSAALLALLLYLIDIAALAALVVRIDLYWLAAATLIMISLRFMMAFRWHYIMVHHGLPVGFGKAVYATFIAATVGPLLPGGIGGDVLRGYHVVNEHSKAASVAATILLDRGVGIFAILLLASLGSAVVWWTEGESKLFAGLVVLQFLVLAGWGAAILWRDRLTRFTPRAKLAAKVWRQVVALFLDLTNWTVLRRVALPILALSLIVHLVRCLMFLCLFRAFGYDQAFVQYVVYIPLVFLAGLLPVSIGGLGVREGALVLFFAKHGVPAEVCIGVGLVLHGLRLLFSALIVVIWFTAIAAARLRRTLPREL